MYYTKYRPQKFSQISKPNATAIALQNQIKSKKTVHAYLFVGSRGTGKTTTARILAKALSCENLSSDGDPCDICDSCEGIRNGSFIDLIEIDAASNRGIDDIRLLREKIKLAPAKGKSKVYIIDEVHMLTAEAFNALLKTLEEPPAKVTFILCTTELHKVPDTIKSRCQVFKFKRATMSQLTEKLKKICEQEGADIREDTLKQIAQTAYGGFRDAETLLQQIVEGELSIDSLASINSQKSYSDFMDLLISKDISGCFFNIGKLYDDGIDLYIWAGELLKYIRLILYIKSGINIEDLEMSDEINEMAQKQASIISTKHIGEILDIVIEAQGNIKNSYITQLPLEIAVVKIANIGNGNEDFNPKDNTDTGTGGHFIQPKNVLEKQDPKEDKKASNKSYNNQINMDKLKEGWKSVITLVQGYNHGVSTLLNASVITSIDTNFIYLEVPFDFYKERLESTKNCSAIEKAVKDVFDVNMTIKCNVKKQAKKRLDEKISGKLTDYNLVSTTTKSDIPTGELLNMLDGSLPFN